MINVNKLDTFQMLDLVPMPLHITNSDNQVVFVNQAWCNVYKISREDATGKTIESLIKIHLNYHIAIDGPPQLYDDDNFVQIKYNHLHTYSSQSTAISALKEKRKVSMVSDALDKGKVIVTSTPIFDDDGEVIYVFTYIHDLSKISDWKESLDREIEKNRVLKRELSYYHDKYNTSKMIGASKTIDEIRKMLPMIAQSDAAVLILGESGVGKEVLAKEIYEQSKRNDKPFISVNCAAIPDHLLESELFGYEKGAFTGATKCKVGLFELANGGTILLDELGSMPLNLQPKLLRVIQEKEFMRVGGLKKIPLDVRIISATNENLFTMIKTGQFRQDLYYRLNVLPIKMPPLRDRKDDIKLLSQKFIDDFNQKYSKNKFLTDRALNCLEKHDWPGNVRELKNAMERLVIIGDKDVITRSQVKHITNPFAEEISSVDHNDAFDFELDFDISELSLKDAVSHFEKRLLQDALEKHGTTYKAAEALGSNQATVARKAKQYGLT